MKIATSSILMSILIVGLAGAASAQSGTSIDGAHLGAANGAGVGTGLGTGLGTGIGTGLAVRTTRCAALNGGLGNGTSAGTSNMRANGTSLNMSPNPRAPNVAGSAFASP
jgi:hypothetical protein